MAVPWAAPAGLIISPGLGHLAGGPTSLAVAPHPLKLLRANLQGRGPKLDGLGRGAALGFVSARPCVKKKDIFKNHK